MDIRGYLAPFATPDPAFSPVPLWWWSGEKLDIDRLIWQLDQLSAMGIHNVVVINLVYTVRQGSDLVTRSACERLLDAVHGEFERRLAQHLGSTIVGSFQDELPDLPGWGGDFAVTFSAKFGYDLKRVIHRLFEEGD